MAYKDSVFPVQKKSLREKNKSWKESSVDGVIARMGMGGGAVHTRKEIMATNYKLYNGEFDKNDLKYIVDPYEVGDTFPASPHEMNIIRPKIDLLVGEESKRPFNFMLIQTNEDAVTELQNKKKEMLTQYILSELGLTDEDLQAATPPEIERYMKLNYKTVAEKQANESLNYLKEKLYLQNEFLKGWKDGLIAGEEIYYVGVNNGEPVLKRVNPVSCDFDGNPDLELIEDGDWFVFHGVMTAEEIYDTYYDKLDESDLNKLLNETKNNGSIESGSKVNTNVSYRLSVTDYGITSPFERQWNALDIYHVVWRSYQKIGFLTITDEFGDEEVIQVDEDYIEQEDDVIDWEWVGQIWEGYRVGDGIYFGIEPLDYVDAPLDSPERLKLPYSGVIYSNTNAGNKSLVSIMKPLQYMYIVLWYRIELMIARDKGKVINMDITQIPKSMGVTPEKWLHYLSALGVNFINPYECFAPGTKILMFDGVSKNIEDIKIGEQVMGPDGEPRTVLETHNGIDNMYKIKPFVGSKEQIVNSKHPVLYKYRETWTGEVTNRTNTAPELLEEFSKNKKRREHYYLERVGHIDNWDSEVPVDPYFLGLWLGDGLSRETVIETADIEVIEYLQKFAENNGLRMSIRETDRSKSVTVYLANPLNGKKGGQMKPNKIRDILKDLGVLNNKHIPNNYIYSTKNNRLRLLAGLIDTDGSFSKSGGFYEFTQCEDRKEIVEVFVFIARSLGFKVSMDFKPGKEFTIHKNTKLTQAQGTWQARVYHGDFDIPVKITRKKHSWKKRRVFNEKYTTFSIEPNGVGEYYGFSIDGDHLFLLDDFTIVHNSGYDIPGREGGKPAGFNQIGAQDLSMTNVIAGYVDLLNKIEEMIGELSGVSKQRQGSIQQRELVGNVERAVIQSSHITEPLFWKHAVAKRAAIRMLLNTAKHAWKNSNKKKLHYIFSDASRIFMDLSEDFLYADFDVFATDATKEYLNLQKLESLLQAAMQNGGTLYDAAEVLTSGNISEVKEKLKEVDQRKQQLEEAQRQHESEMSQMQVQAEMEKAAEENRIKEEDSIRKAQTSIEVALINSESGEGDDGFKQQLDMEKLKLDEEKQKREAELKKKQVEESVRSNKMDETLRREEIAIKRKQKTSTTNK